MAEDRLKTIKITVGGIEYKITSADDEAYIRSLEAELNRRMDQIARDNPFLSTTMTAVTAALKYLDEARKEAAEAARLRETTGDYLRQAADARREAEEARREILRLSEEIRKLRGLRSEP